jgi:hypothetical protein
MSETKISSLTNGNPAQAAVTTQYSSGLNGVFPMQGGFAGLTWCKTIWSMMFGFFSKAQSTPYSGQLFPTGSAQTTNGQSSPVG